MLEHGDTNSLQQPIRRARWRLKVWAESILVDNQGRGGVSDWLEEGAAILSAEFERVLVTGVEEAAALGPAVDHLRAGSLVAGGGGDAGFSPGARPWTP